MAKLYALFAGADLSTELNSDRCTPSMWIIGRQPRQGDRTGLYFRGPEAKFVSRKHAIVRFTPIGDSNGAGEGLWEIQHLSESGYTFKNTYDRQSLLKPGQWYSIVDGDRFFFTKPDNWLYFSTHSDDTIEVEREMIPVEEKTINLDKEVSRYQSQQKTQAQSKDPDSFLSFLTAILKTLWKGPLEADSPLWLKVGWQMFIVLVVAGIFAVFGIEKIIGLLLKMIL